MKKLVFVALAAVLASAQAPADPIMTNYRAYRAAVEAGDLATAETAARAAWEASNARDGNGGRTGVLALNYAKIALTNGHREAAYQPALQAFTIAGSTQAGGLDPVLTRLVLGRAELAREEGADAAQVLAALNDARTRADVGPDAYEAATDLGNWALSQQNYELAATGFGHAAGYAGFAPDNHDLALGQARTAEGVALYTVALRAENDDWRTGLGRTGSSIRGSDMTETYRRAQAALVAAEEALFPLAAQQPGADNGLTRAQRDFALAHAWRTIINARLNSNDQDQLLDPDVNLRMQLPGAGPLCHIRVISQPEPRYPAGAAAQGRYGAVVVRMLLNEDGTARDAKVAAALPEQFGAPVEQVAGRWRTERAPDSPAICRVQPVTFYTYMFYLR